MIIDTTENFLFPLKNSVAIIKNYLGFLVFSQIFSQAIYLPDILSGFPPK